MTLFGQAPFRYRPDPAWDKFPGNGPLGEAVGVATDSRGRVFVFLRSPTPVRVYESDGTQAGAWGEGLIVRAHGITIGPDDTVYLVDDFGHNVHACTPEGKVKFSLGSGKPSDTGATSIDYRTIKRVAGPFCYPTNLAVAPNGDLFVADGYGNARVHRFSPDGKHLSSWGGIGAEFGQFNVVHGIAVDSEGTVYVADRENCRLQLFGPDGENRGFWEAPGVLDRPCEVFIGKDAVYVAELGHRAGRWPGTGSHEEGDAFGRVSIFDEDGVLLSQWGDDGDPTAPGNFWAPHDVWVDGQGDLYVAEVAYSGGGASGLVAPSCHCLQKFIRERAEP